MAYWSTLKARRGRTMRTTIKAILFLVIALAVSIVIGKLSKENKRLQSNQEALLKECDTLRTENGMSMARVKQLELTANEFEESCTQLAEQVAELGIKNSRLQFLVHANSATAVRIDTITRDSIIYIKEEGRADTLRCFEFDDGWVQANGCINKAGRLQADFVSNDTLLVVAHRVPKRFLFFSFGCKYIELNVTTSNPHTRLESARYIKFTKK
jgi:uncharacterized protein YoxC